MIDACLLKMFGDTVLRGFLINIYEHSFDDCIACGTSAVKEVWLIYVQATKEGRKYFLKAADILANRNKKAHSE